MATIDTTVPSIAGPSPAVDAVNVNDLATSLYEKCRTSFAPDFFFYPDDVYRLRVIPNSDPNILNDCSSRLVAQRLFRVLYDSEQRVGWKLVPRNIANNYKQLNGDESLIYGVIQSSGKAGIWTRNIKTRTSLAQATVTQCLKKLENKNLIKPFKDVKFPSRKMYMLFGLQPTETTTGGAWFTEGVLDDELIRIVGVEIQKYVARGSWHEVSTVKSAPPDKTDEPQRKRAKSSRPRHDGADEASSISRTSSTFKNGTALAAEANADPANRPLNKKRDSAATGLRESQSPPAKRRKEASLKSYVPYPAGYVDYPTVTSITSYINDTKLVKIPFTEDAIGQLLEVLAWDDKIIKVNYEPPMYRSPYNVEVVERQSKREYHVLQNEAKLGECKRDFWLEEWERNGMTEAPCGRCPVFDLCEDGGPVNAGNCEYMEKWLTF